MEKLRNSPSSIFGTWEWKLDSPDVHCSDGIFGIYELDPAPGNFLSSTHFFQLPGNGKTAFLHEQVHNSRERGEILFELPIITKKGVAKQLHGWVSPQHGKDGEVCCMLGAFTDITRLSADAVSQNFPVETLDHTESLAKMARWQWNPTRNEFKVSSNFWSLFGLDLHSYKPTYENFVGLIHPDDQHKLTSVLDNRVETKSHASVEIRMLKTKSHFLHIKSIYSCGVDKAGEMIVTGTLQDITEEMLLRRELEEKKLFAEMLFDKSVDLISAYDTSFKIIAWNKTCEERYKVKKENAIGKGLLQLYPELENDTWFKDLSKAVKGEYIFRTNQASQSLEGHFDNYLLPLITDDGEILGAVSISHDLTEMRQVAQRLDELNHTLEEKNQELERSNQELASFSYVASHDLQEPLRKIQTFSQRISEIEADRISDQGKDYLKRMDGAARRMQTLIEDLLTFSRTNTSLKTPERVDLQVMTDEVRSQFKEVIDEKNAVIETHNLPIANVVSFQFRQLLENLLSNALKYSKPDEQLKIKISSQLLAGTAIKLQGINQHRSYHKISFEDNGIGFEPRYAEKIFELFQRLHGKYEYPGTGLGLSICKKIIQNHDGFITATGIPGQGATFTLFLPE